MRVFKYRGGNNERDLNSLKKNCFWAPNFENLNDPCETLILTDNFKEQTSEFTSIFGEAVRKDLLKVHEALDQVVSRGNEIGIYSLSQTYKDELLWAHYADSHRGFCIEYDLEILTKSYPMDNIYSFPVTYSQNPPEVDWADISNSKELSIVKKLGGNKSLRWEYEEEHRIIIDKSGNHIYDYSALKAIYFGLRMEKSWRERIMSELSGRGLEFYEMVQVPGKYLFEREGIKIESQEVTYLRQIPQSVGGKRKVDFEILEKEFNKFNGKATILISLKEKITEDELRWLAITLKENLFWTAKRTFISVMIDGMVLGNGYWGTAKYEGDELEEISIHGLTIEDEMSLKLILRNANQSVIGKWLDETPFIPSAMILKQDGNGLVLETHYVGESHLSEGLDACEVEEGIRYDPIDGNDHGEYFIVDRDKYLRYYSEHGLFKELKPFL